MVPRGGDVIQLCGVLNLSATDNNYVVGAGSVSCNPIEHQSRGASCLPRTSPVGAPHGTLGPHASELGFSSAREQTFSRGNELLPLCLSFGMTRVTEALPKAFFREFAATLTNAGRSVLSVHARLL